LSIHWPQLTLIATVCIWGAMIFSLLSAVDYFWKFWRKVDDKVKLRRRRELLISERRRNRRATAKDLPQPSD
jgi:CDP-diacylglycerol--glycerol-3-phosphate 3-phosphatidyltransferase